MKRRRRIAAYGVCRDGAHRVLLVRARKGHSSAGRWFLPGGGVEHGEHPANTVVREVEEETGLRVVVDGLRDVMTDIDSLLDILVLRHHDRIVYDVHTVGGALRDEIGGTTDLAAWVEPEALGGLPLMPYVARVLGVTLPRSTRVGIRHLLTDLIHTDLTHTDLTHADAAPVETRRQRFAAYGLVTDPAGRVLLTQIAQGYPGAGRWHLPGGGTDFGESAVDGVLRELIEETDQRGRVTGLISVSHRHEPLAFGPEGVPVDWHGVRAIFRIQVDSPTPPRVVEAGGSTVGAAWVWPGEAMAQSLTEVAHDIIANHLGL